MPALLYPLHLMAWICTRRLVLLARKGEVIRGKQKLPRHTKHQQRVQSPGLWITTVCCWERDLFLLAAFRAIWKCTQRALARQTLVQWFVRLHGFTPKAWWTRWLEALLSTSSVMRGPDPASGMQSSPEHGPLALGVSCTKQSSPGLGGGRLPSSDHRAAANMRIKKRFCEGSFLLTTPTRRKHKT